MKKPTGAFQMSVKQAQLINYSSNAVTASVNDEKHLLQILLH